MSSSSLILFLRHKLRQFAQSESGITLPLLALSMVAMVTFTGIAIDTARTQMVQSKLRFSLDAAGLAAGSTVSTSNLQSETANYLDANFNGYLGSKLTGSTVSANSNNTVFTLSATANVPTTFMQIVGINSVNVSATSQISRATTGLELVFVLDNTGSMAQSAGGSTSKIQALQTATTTLINTLFGGQSTSTNGKLWVGLVPFSLAVNIGTSHSAWLGNVSSANSSWNGCVDARQNGYDITDDPPSQSDTWTLFNLRSYNQCAQTYKRCNSSGGSCSTVTGTCSTSGGHTCTSEGTVCTVVGSCTVKTGVTCTPVEPYQYTSPLPSGTSTYGQLTSCSQQVTPMTNDSTTLLSAVNAMSANGNTVINQGMIWGWRMLSPRWRGYWGGTMDANSLPLDYNTKGMVKAIVLVTDGENTIDNSSQGSYWYVNNKWLGTTNTTTAVSDLDAKTLAVCQAMKNEGIYIYTIGLGTNGGINTSELQSCATVPAYYFPSPTTDQLTTIFSQIGDSLASLRVSE